MSTKCMTMVMVAIASFSLWAGTWYADASRPDDTGDGTSAETAKKTIQAAVSAAESSGETTLVVKVAPGTYDSGEVADSNGAKNRVVITKKLTLESLGARDDTFIVGAKDGSGSYGLGTGSVRGICVDGAAAAGTVVKGFTFKDCSAGKSNGKTELAGHGGAVCFNQETCDVYVKDCAAVDCAAYFGGGFRGIVALRSMVKGCHNNNAESRGAALYGCKAYSCIFVANGATDSYAEHTLQGVGPYVNCTAVANNGSLLRTSSSQRMYNSISTMASRQEFDGTNNGGANVIAEYNNGSTGFTNWKQVSNSSEAFYKLLVSPWTGDYRPVAGGDADSYGDTQWCEQDWIPETDRNLDYNGNPRIVNGQVDVGAIQGAVTVSGGVLKHQDKVTTTGASTYTRNWYANCAGETWVPVMVRVTPPEGTFCCTVEAVAAMPVLKTIRYVDQQGGFWQPVPSSGIWCVTPVAATATLWVDERSAAVTPTGNEAAPYKTIQAAVDAAVGTDYTIINVKPGTYEGGETVAVGLKSCVAIDRKNVFLRAVGEGDHIIRGKWHESATGCGANAVRCVAIDHGASASDYLVAVQGFRLENGATLTGDSTNGTRGGAVCALPFVSTTACLYAQVLDCSIVNCVGSVTLANSVWFQGCSFADCPSASAAIRQSVATSCTFENVAGTASLLAEDSIAVGCSFSAEANGVRMPIGAPSASFYNSIITGGNINREIGAYGVYLYDMKKTDSTRGVPKDGSVWTDVDPIVVFTSDGRAPLLQTSPAFGRWTVAEAALENVLAYLDADQDGVPLQMTADGKVTPGACHSVYEPKDVYVDASRPDDSGDGLSSETAKRTLAAAMSVALVGDNVLMAGGMYDEGEMNQPAAVVDGSAFTVKARVVVPRHATLVGTGADNTTICGGFVQDGVGALVRCVILGAGATLKGVTVANGLCVTNNTGTIDDNCYAAGVLADRSAVVEDCLIEDNRSYTYGAVYGGTFRRCTFRANWAMKGSGGVSVGSVKTLENCLVSGNRGGTVVADYVAIDNCTFLYDNVQLNGTSRIDNFGTYETGARISNSALILSPTGENTPVPDLYNSLLPKIGGNSWKWNPLSTQDCLLSETSFTPSWNGAPTEDYIGLDRGGNAYAPAGNDLANVQRIQNATVDIGAYEYNWMPTYSTALSKRGWVEVVATAGAVTDATPGGISFGTDGSLTAIVRNDPGKDVTIGAAVSEGVLVVTVNGTERGHLTSDLAKLNLGALNVGDKIELAFADTGSAVIAGLKGASGLFVIVR